MHDGVWDKSAKGSHEVRGRTLGIVGYGNIGTQLSNARRGARHAGDLLRHRRPAGPRQRPPHAHRSTSCSAEADVVTPARRRPPRQRRPLRRRAVRADEAARAVHQRRRAAWSSTTTRCASTSCPATSPAPRSTSSRSSPKAQGDAFESPLRGLDNVILTPHVGGSTQEAQEEIGWFVAGKLAGFVARGPHRAVGQPARGRCRPALPSAFRIGLPARQRARRARRGQPRARRRRAPTSSASTSSTRGEQGYVVTDADRADQLHGRTLGPARSIAAHDLAARVPA